MTRTRTTPPAEAPADRKAPPVRLIPDDAWVTCDVVDATVKPTHAGEPRALLQLEVIAPRGYAGRTLYFATQPSLDKTQAALDKEFPGVNWTDADKLWDSVGHATVRAHVFSDPEGVDADTKQVYAARNRVTSIWKAKERNS